MDIYKKAHYYDCINDFDFDVDFFIDFAQKQGGNVLELACGTGRLTIPLAKEGVKITGIDNAEEMIALAEEKATKLGLNVDFHLKDLLDFDLNEKFNFIFCVHNSFSHIDGFENVKQFFSNVSEHLEDDGTFILQVFNPDFFFFTRDPNDKFPLKTFKDPFSDKIISLSENSFYDEETQINYLKWFFEKEGEEESIENWSQRVYYPKELEYIVQFCGFEIVDKFGDFDFTPFENDSETQILVLKKKK